MAPAAGTVEAENARERHKHGAPDDHPQRRGQPILCSAHIRPFRGSPPIGSISRPNRWSTAARRADGRLAPTIWPPHYHDYPAVLVRLAAIEEDELAEVLEDSWRRKAPKRLIAERDATRGPSAGA
jgi:hypothetical protein